MIDVEPHVLRYWESEFRELAPKKNRAGRRIYRNKDIEMLKRIKHLLKDKKYTIEGARLALPMDANDESSVPKKELLQIRSFLQKLLDSL